MASVSSLPSDPYSVTFSTLNSETMFSPDLSENGKNLAKKSSIRPQKTVFWDLESLRNRSLQILNKWFLQGVKNWSSLNALTFSSTNWNSSSHMSRVTTSNTSPSRTTAIEIEVSSFFEDSMANLMSFLMVGTSRMNFPRTSSRNVCSIAAFLSISLDCVNSSYSVLSELTSSNFSRIG